MGIFSVPVTIRNLAPPHREHELSLMVDTGSLFTWISAPTLEKIGVRPVGSQKFQTITGSLIERKYGYLEVGYAGHSGAMNVVFGEPGDMEVLGVTALETMCVAADPVKQVLTPVVALAV